MRVMLARRKRSERDLRHAGRYLLAAGIVTAWQESLSNSPAHA